MSTGGFEFSVYYHTHWDREWYQPFRAYQVRLAEVVDDVLDRLERDVLPCFVLDGQTVVLEDYLELRPHNRERLKALIEQERLSIGPWYVAPDEFLVGGESLIRNLAFGIRQSYDWGCRRFTGYLPDTFGHSADMPAIFRQFGIQSAVLWRGVHPEKSLFQWQAADGSSVLTAHLTDGYFQMILHDWTLDDAGKRQALAVLMEKLNATASRTGLVLMPIGGDHLGPVTKKGHDLLKAQYPNMKETTPERYLAEVTERAGLTAFLGELTDNTGSFLLPGVASSRMYLKQANRRLEHRLTHQLEPMLALAQVVCPSSRYPAEELNLAWKTLILNHPHDSICGCSVDAVHRENEVRFDQVFELTDALMARAHRTLSGLGAPDDWVLVNTGDSPYTGVVPAIEDVPDAETPSNLLQMASEETVLQDEYLADTQRIPLAHLTRLRRTGWIYAEQLPAFSAQALPKAQTFPPSIAVKVDETLLENEFLSVRVESTGTLTVQNLKTGTETSGLLVFTSRPDQGDSYNSAPVPGLENRQAKFKSAKILAEGPLVGILTLTHVIEEIGLELYTEVRLDAKSPLLQFETRFTNTVQDHKLQVSFETGQPVTKVQAESHLGVILRRYDPGYREADYMPVEPWKELKTSTGPVQRFFSANAHSFITEGLCEYEVEQSRINITLMRAFGMLSKADTGVRGAQAGPPFETPEGQCLNRRFACRYAWLPTPRDVEALYRAANQFYGVVWARSGTALQAAEKTEATLVTWDAPELVVPASYWLPGQGLVLRLLNTSSREVTTTFKTGFPVQAVKMLDFLDEPQESLSNGTAILGAYGVQTLLFAVG